MDRLPREPKRASDPEATALIQVRIPGWMKNQILDLVESGGISLNAWLVAAIRSHLCAGQGIPLPPQARAPLPSPEDHIRAWVEGEKVLTPCGKRGTCPGLDPENQWSSDGLTFCRECGIRVA